MNSKRKQLKTNVKVWDKIWEKDILDVQIIAYEKQKKSLKWEIIKDYVNNNFDSFEGLKVIELGGGSGKYSAIFASNDCDVSVFDRSKEALKISQALFKKLELKGRFINGDALDINKNLIGNYDISVSMGLAEHFQDRLRKKILDSHFNLLKKDGIAI